LNRPAGPFADVVTGKYKNPIPGAFKTQLGKKIECITPVERCHIRVKIVFNKESGKPGPVFRAPADIFAIVYLLKWPKKIAGSGRSAFLYSVPR
jgi:hypothetical protein